MALRAGITVTYWPWFSFEEQVRLARLADEVGLDLVWTAEAWGQDAVSLLGYVSAAAQGGSVMPIILAATGLGVFITTLWSAMLGQTFVAAVFGAFTGFWWSYAVLVLGRA